ncbi:NEAT domain-containing protein [Staphylococcus auricularis]|uniref:NEAT domain-containing protein n=1 Tax=Staphylococcus auricularis TaxID=29379 RepID=UPI003EB6EF89
MSKSWKTLVATTLVATTLTQHPAIGTSFGLNGHVLPAENNAGDPAFHQITPQNFDESKTQPVSFTVLKENQQDVSSMQRSMDTTSGKIVEVNGQKMVVLTITRQKLWQDFKVDSGQGLQSVNAIALDEANDTKTVMFPYNKDQALYQATVGINAGPMGLMQHTTYIKVDAPADQETPTQPEETTAPNTNDNAGNAPSETTPAPDNTNNATPEAPADQGTTPAEGNHGANEATPTAPSDTSQANPAVGQETIDYEVYKDGTTQTSVMDGYMEKPAKLVHENGKTYVDFTLQYADWWKSFELYEGDRQLPTQVVVEDKENDKRVVRAEITPGTTDLNSKVHIIVTGIPNLNYNHKYTTQIHFKSPVPAPVVNEEEKPEENTQPPTDNETTPPVDNGAEQPSDNAGDKPADNEADKPSEDGNKPADNDADKPSEETDKPADNDADKPSEDGNKPADNDADKPSEDSDKPADNEGDKPSEDGNKPADNEAEKPSEDGNKPVDNGAEQPSDNPGDKPADNDADKPSDDSNKPSDNDADKPSEDSNKPADNEVDKPAEDNQATQPTAPSTNPPKKEDSANEAAQKVQNIGYQVHKDGTKEQSVMDTYMTHPAKLITKNGKQYVQVNLNNASWWRAFELYEDGKKLDIRTVSEANDQRLIEFEVQPGTKVLNSKVHIVVTGVPGLHYDNHYTTQLEFDQAIPEVEKDAPAKDEQQDEGDKPSNNEAPSSNDQQGDKPSSDEGSTSEQKPDKPSSNHEHQKGDKPSKHHHSHDTDATNMNGTNQNNHHQHNDATNNKKPDQKQQDVNQQAINFKVVKNGTNQISVMDGYMQHPAHLVTKDGKQYLEFTIDHASWWKAFDIYHNGQKLPMTTVKEQNDTRTVHVEVQPGMEQFDAKVHIVVPGINYDNHYTTQILLEKAVPEMGQMASDSNDAFDQTEGNGNAEQDTVLSNASNDMNGGSGTSSDAATTPSDTASGQDGTMTNNATSNNSTSPAASTTSDASNNSAQSGSNSQQATNPQTSGDTESNYVVFAAAFGLALISLVGSFFFNRRQRKNEANK